MLHVCEEDNNSFLLRMEYSNIDISSRFVTKFIQQAIAHDLY